MTSAPRRALVAAFCLAATAWAATPAAARSLDAMRQRGQLGICAHPNSLPFASKTSTPPGFQIELGRALAKQLGLILVPDWIVVTVQIFRADCDIVLDTIAVAEAQADSGLKLSKPYYRSGVALVVPSGSPITGFSSLNKTTKVGVMVGSLAAMDLNMKGVPTSTFGFEEEMLDALANHEIDAAAVTPLSAGYFNLKHPDQRMTIIPPDESHPDLVWNVAVGLRRPDDKLREAVDAAMAHLREDGTVKAIYAKYGISLQDPK